MGQVLQLRRELTSPPTVPVVPGVRVRTYRGESDINHWLKIRRRAFLEETPKPRDWSKEDFQREFLIKPWWNSGRQWYAEVEAVADKPTEAVGTITLADRGFGEKTKPAVHWLAVVPEHRRRGIARLLLATLELACWKADRREVWLETHANWTGVSFYEDVGFVQS